MKNEEEEKRRIEARREKQRRRREKNSEKYGDGYRFVVEMSACPTHNSRACIITIIFTLNSLGSVCFMVLCIQISVLVLSRLHISGVFRGCGGRGRVIYRHSKPLYPGNILKCPRNI